MRSFRNLINIDLSKVNKSKVKNKNRTEYNINDTYNESAHINVI